MIYRLQRKFILICALSVLLVVSLVFAVILVWNVSSMNRNIDVLADRVSEGGGRFPDSFGEKPPHDKEFHGSDRFITPETPFSTRHFTVIYDKDGSVDELFTESIYSITDETAVEYAEKAIEGSAKRGWISNYRYKVFETKNSFGVVFVDGSTDRILMKQSITIAGFVLMGCAAFVLLLVILLSKRAVKPIAESYEKQKQFVTDANHELKTPLTLILANADIAESELGKNEWIDGIRTEGERMAALVNQLVSLSRMDEEKLPINTSEFAIDKLVDSAVNEYRPIFESRKKTLDASIEKGVSYFGDVSLLSRLIGILLDNALKYCDDGGDTVVTLKGGRRIILTVENSYSFVGEIELQRLFDRFYRADTARKFKGSYGVGLSMAKAIVERHKGTITAYKKDDRHIGFKVVL